MAQYTVDYVLFREVRDGRVTVEAVDRRTALALAHALIEQALPEPKSEFEIKIGVAKRVDT